MKKRLYSVLALCGLLLLCGCGQQQQDADTRMPQPDFPLTEEVVLNAMPGWEISDTLEHDVDGVVTYMLRREGAESNLNGIIVNRYDLPELGRTLTIRKLESNTPGAEHPADPQWSDYEDIFTLMETLYGGFTDRGVLYAAVSSTELPETAGVLWAGKVEGGAYLEVSSRGPMMPSRLDDPIGNTVTFRLYESETAYLAYEAAAKQAS